METILSVGLEVHVELNTKTKLFCSCSTRFGAPPNSQCCPVCSGAPGALPAINRKAVEYALRLGAALGCSLNETLRFDRKNYFYPDLPKGYQITQFYHPVCRDGALNLDGRPVRIREIHLEEDAGKLVRGKDGALYADYNRCGVPLVEIVTQADMHSPKEAVAFLEKLRLYLLYLDISDGRMEEGSLRADVNVSVRPATQDKLGTRTEMKNLSSFRAVARAITSEASRQKELLERGQPVVFETRRWDEEKGCSFSMRRKESNRDYRYFPEPDLPCLKIPPQWREAAQRNLPELPDQKLERYQQEAGLSKETALVLLQHPAVAQYYEAVAAQSALPLEAAQWIQGELYGLFHAKKQAFHEKAIPPSFLAALLKMLHSGTINRSMARAVLEEGFGSGRTPEEIVQARGFGLIAETETLSRAIEQTLLENPKAVASWKEGKSKAFQFLMGQCMKALRGKADPGLLQEMLAKRLLAADEN